MGKHQMSNQANDGQNGSQLTTERAPADGLVHEKRPLTSRSTLTETPALRLPPAPPRGATCCRCDEPINDTHAFALVPGLRRDGWAHRTCLPTERHETGAPSATVNRHKKPETAWDQGHGRSCSTPQTPRRCVLDPSHQRCLEDAGGTHATTKEHKRVTS